MLFDTHAHLFNDRFAADLPQVLQRAQAAGVMGVLAVGIDHASSLASIQQARQWSMVHAAVGIQPNHAAEAKPEDWDAIALLAETEPTAAAIGETGLDRYWDFAPFGLQEEYFARHLALARRLGKPVVIHCRDAEADVLRMLRDDFDRHGPVCGVMHSFSGDAATMEGCLAMGLHISFAGMVTYKNAASLRELACQAPLERLLIETDCPYLAPVPVRGRRNEPAFVAHTAACIASTRGMSAVEFAQITTTNAQQLFGLHHLNG